MTLAMIPPLQDAFARIEVKLVVEPRSTLHGGHDVRGLESSLRLTILPGRGRRGPERVSLWPGTADIAVHGTSKRLRQVVLRVVQAPRERMTRRPARRGVVRWERHTSPAEDWAILVGVDERRLFLAPLPAIAFSVEHAHALLTPDRVRAACRLKLPVLRQGEHFFTPAPKTARTLLEIAEHRGCCGSEPVVPYVGDTRARRPGLAHVASLAAWVDGRQYVAGTVSHPDHRALELPTWMRAELNTEVVHHPSVAREWID